MTIHKALKNLLNAMGIQPTDDNPKILSSLINDIANGYSSSGGGGGSDPLVVTFTQGESWSADKTFNEVKTALVSGKSVVGCLENNGFYSYLFVTFHTATDITFSWFPEVDGGVYSSGLQLNDDNSVSYFDYSFEGGGDGGEDQSSFVVTFEYDANYNIHASESFVDTLNALTAGKSVFGRFDGALYYVGRYNNTLIYFSGLPQYDSTLGIVRFNSLYFDSNDGVDAVPTDQCSSPSVKTITFWYDSATGDYTSDVSVSVMADLVANKGVYLAARVNNIDGGVFLLLSDCMVQSASNCRFLFTDPIVHFNYPGQDYAGSINIVTKSFEISVENGVVTKRKYQTVATVSGNFTQNVDTYPASNPIT